MGFIFAVISLIFLCVIIFPRAAIVAGFFLVAWMIGWKLSVVIVTSFVALLIFTSKPLKFYEAWIENYKHGENPLRQHHLNGQRVGKFIVQNGITIDTETGLTWCRFVYGQKWKNGKVVGEAIKVGWMKALAAANQAGGYENYTDWRIPTCDELKTLAHDEGNSKNRYCIDTEVFSKPDWGASFWSFTSDRQEYLRVVDFGYSIPWDHISHKEGSPHYVRLVRGP